MLEQEHGTQYSCGCCDNQGWGYYAPHVEPTLWWIGLDCEGQAHYLCDNCKNAYYNVYPLRAVRGAAGVPAVKGAKP